MDTAHFENVLDSSRRIILGHETLIFFDDLLALLFYFFKALEIGHFGPGIFCFPLVQLKLYLLLLLISDGKSSGAGVRSSRCCVRRWVA